MANPTGILFVEPKNKPLSTTGLQQANVQRAFFVTGTTTVAPVYSDGFLQTVLAQNVIADGNGQFVPIYLDPAVVYRAQLLASNGTTVLEDIDPYVVAPRNYFVKIKPAASPRVNNTVSADPDLQIPIPGAGTFAYEALIEIQTAGASGNNPGLTLTMAFPSGSLVAGAASTFAVEGNANGGVATNGTINVNQNFGLTTLPALNFLLIRGVLTCSAAGTLSVNWGQQTTNATATTLNQACTLLAQQIG